ncbi:MAG TPA: FeoC-like transcriptional regulator [Stenomitos sp.]
MLRDLLDALYHSPTASGLEIRSRLGLAREAYEDLLAHLIRLGYVQADTASHEDAACPSGSCKGCPIACQSSPSLGPQTLRITERGIRFLGKRGTAQV